MQRIGPQVGIRALREAHALTLPALAERLQSQFGIKVHPDHLNNVELGHKRGSKTLMVAWAKCLNVSPLDVRQSDELRDALGERDTAGIAS